MQKYKKWGSFFNVLVFVIKAKAEAKAEEAYYWDLDLCLMLDSAFIVHNSNVLMLECSSVQI